MLLMWCTYLHNLVMCILAQEGLEDTGNTFFIFRVPINSETNSMKCFFVFV